MHHCRYLPLTGNYKETWWLYYIAFSGPVKRTRGREIYPQVDITIRFFFFLDFLNQNYLRNYLNIYIFCFILLFTSSSPFRKDQFAVSYFSTSLIVLIQVYNWEAGTTHWFVAVDLLTFYIL